MYTEEQILSKFKEKAIFKSGELYFSTIEALKFVNFCQKNNFAIIGLEGFFYKKKEVYPQLDMIVDYSSLKTKTWEEFQNQCNDSIKKYLSTLKSTKEIVINFTIFSKEEWRKKDM